MPDVTEILIHDHREVEEIFGKLEALFPLSDKTEEQQQEAKTLVEQAVVELVRHSIAEEEYVYPTAERVLPNGKEEADHERQEHQEAEETMNKLEKLEPTDADFEPTVRQLMEEIRHHVEEEEGDLFPKLRENCSAEELDELGEKVESAKKTAPTRPHPSAPNTPPWNKLAAPGAALVDRVRDLITGRAKG